MKAVVLAAGQGTRLRDIAASKPLASVLGVALIERVIGAAHAGGVDGFVVVTGYEAEPLEAHLAEAAARRGIEVRTVRNPDWRLANGLSALAAAAALDGPFLLLMSDHLFDPSIVADMIARAGEPGLTLAIDRRLDNPLIDLDDVTRVRTDPQGRIVAIGKHLDPYDCFDTGIFVADSSLFEAIGEDVAGGGAGSLSAGVQRLAARGLARTFDVGARFWLDIDDAVAFGHVEREEARVALRS